MMVSAAMKVRTGYIPQGARMQGAGCIPHGSCMQGAGCVSPGACMQGAGCIHEVQHGSSSPSRVP
eukprot:1161841-Pelagomonas_calceolata.AAC.8